MVFDRIKKSFSNALNEEEVGDEYLELDLSSPEKDKPKVQVKLFVLKNYEEVNDILNELRTAYTIAVVDIKVLRQKDSIELKRAISKIKKTCDALNGSIAGFGENIVIVTPEFAKIKKQETGPKEEPKSRWD